MNQSNDVILNIITVPSDIGSVYPGKSKAPESFRTAGLYSKLKNIGFLIKEYEAVTSNLAGWESSTRSPNGARNEAKTVQACSKVHTTVTKSLQDNPIPTFQLLLTGECLYIPAILSAYCHHLSPTNNCIGIIYIDANADLHTPAEPNTSGNIAGMTLTHMTLRDGALDSMKQCSRPDGSPVVNANNIVLFGTNINSEANLRPHLGYLFDNNFHVVTSTAVQQSPVERAKAALRWLEERADYVLVHLDVDVIDPGEFPLCNVPNWTGLGFEETMAAVDTFLASEVCVGFSVAEVNPDHDPGLEMTGRLVDRVAEALGKRV